MTEYRLISSDSHITIPVTAWQEYLDPEFRDRAPRIVETDEGDFQEFTFDEEQPGTVTEIYLRSIEVVETGEIPTPSVVPIADLEADKAEPWEGVLIEVQNVAVTAVDAEHNEFTIGATLQVDDTFYAAQVQEGMQLSRIVGPLTFSNGVYKLLPRSAEDLTE